MPARRPYADAVYRYASTATGLAPGIAEKLEIAAGVDERMIPTLFMQERRCLFEGITLGKTAEIQLHPGIVRRDVIGVNSEIAVA